MPETVSVLGTLSQMTVIYPINLNPDVADASANIEVCAARARPRHLLNPNRPPYKKGPYSKNCV